MARLRARPQYKADPDSDQDLTSDESLPDINTLLAKTPRAKVQLQQSKAMEADHGTPTTSKIQTAGRQRSLKPVGRSAAVFKQPPALDSPIASLTEKLGGLGFEEKPPRKVPQKTVKDERKPQVIVDLGEPKTIKNEREQRARRIIESDTESSDSELEIPISELRISDEDQSPLKLEKNSEKNQFQTKRRAGEQAILSASVTNKIFNVSDVEDDDAILRFSPPRSRSPRKVAPTPSIIRPKTPPATAEPLISWLVSPSKHKRIPTPPHALPGHDNFWDAGVINDWNEQHSPQKTIPTSPRKNQPPVIGTPRLRFPPSLGFGAVEDKEGISVAEFIGEEDLSDSSFDSAASPMTSPRKQRPTKSKSKPTPSTKDSSKSIKDSKKAVQAARKEFEATKHEIATSFLRELDQAITGGQITALISNQGSTTSTPAGIPFIWTNKLNTTAGRASYRREAIRTRNSDPSSSNPITTTYRNIASIELASKVITTPHRLINVLAHEYAHLATFMISNVRNNPHGKEFKKWASMITEKFKSRDICVTTKHNYEIEYRYHWTCTSTGTVTGTVTSTGQAQGPGKTVACGMVYKRHSKSIDPKRHTCGACRSALVQTKPVPRVVATAAATVTVGNTTTTTSKATGNTQSVGGGYQVFVKQNFKKIRDEIVAARAAAGAGAPNSTTTTTTTTTPLLAAVMEELGRRYRRMKMDGGEKGGVVTGGEIDETKGEEIHVA